MFLLSETGYERPLVDTDPTERNQPERK